jgi:hypothetical protein
MHKLKKEKFASKSRKKCPKKLFGKGNTSQGAVAMLLLLE